MSDIEVIEDFDDSVQIVGANEQRSVVVIDSDAESSQIQGAVLRNRSYKANLLDDLFDSDSDNASDDEENHDIKRVFAPSTTDTKAITESQEVGSQDAPKSCHENLEPTRSACSFANVQTAQDSSPAESSSQPLHVGKRCRKRDLLLSQDSGSEHSKVGDSALCDLVDSGSSSDSDDCDEKYSRFNTFKSKFADSESLFAKSRSSTSDSIKNSAPPGVVLSLESEGDSDDNEVDKDNKFKSITEQSSQVSVPSDPIESSFTESSWQAPPSKRSTRNATSTPKESLFSRFSKQEIAKANKASRRKDEICSEMTLNITPGLLKMFGVTHDRLETEFKPISVKERDMGQVFKDSKNGVFLSDAVKLLANELNVITFSLVSNKEYLPDEKAFLPSLVPIEIVRPVVVFLYDTEQFYHEYQSGGFVNTFTKFQANGGSFFEQRVLVLTKYEVFLSKIRRTHNQSYSDKIRTIMEPSAAGVASQPSKKKRKANTPKIDFASINVEDIRGLLLRLQMKFNVHIFPVNNTADLSSWLKSMTYCAGLSFYDEIAKDCNPYAEVRTKSAATPSECFELALEQLKFVSKSVAERISMKYKTVAKFHQEISEGSSIQRSEDGALLVNSNIENILARLFTSDNPDELLYEE